MSQINISKYDDVPKFGGEEAENVPMFEDDQRS